MNSFFPAEWYPQSAIQLTWPHENTDWAEILDEVSICYIQIAKAILQEELLLIVCVDKNKISSYFTAEELINIRFLECDTNDTWARDHGGIIVFENGLPQLLDFKFNGWGLKFAANFDNLITSKLQQAGIFNPEVKYQNQLSFALEGGALESDGKGTLLTTSECLLSPNRNGSFSKLEIENFLKTTLFVQRVLWLNHGYLAGDDTDSHIDTLARFTDENTIVYVKCEDDKDEHFSELQKMERELQSFKKLDGSPYTLVALPMAKPVFDDEQRLPATYANFLILNGVVLLPFYNTELDAKALAILQTCFPDRKVIGIDCTSLIKQNGSLHCITMQYPKNVIQ